MHRWYDKKHGMFHVLTEDEVRMQYAPREWAGEVMSPGDAEVLGLSAARPCDLRRAEDMIAAGLDVRLDVDASDASEDVVGVGDFERWFLCKDLDLAAQLFSWYVGLEAAAEGTEHAQGVFKVSDTETVVDLFGMVKDDMRGRELLEEGEVRISGLARWCREVVGGRFGACAPG